MLGELWKCDEMKINPNELKNNRLLAKDKNEQITLHSAARHVCWRKFEVA
jgi:hypothetical protein